jgi:hypothetical protein
MKFREFYTNCASFLAISPAWKASALPLSYTRSGEAALAIANLGPSTGMASLLPA